MVLAKPLASGLELHPVICGNAISPPGAQSLISDNLHEKLESGRVLSTLCGRRPEIRFLHFVGVEDMQRCFLSLKQLPQGFIAIRPKIIRNIAVLGVEPLTSGL